MDKVVFSLAAAYLLANLVSCQHEQARGGFQHGNRPPANILLHKQALGQDGSFNYAFAADNGLQQGEVINPDGSRKGSYSYVDPNGKTVTLSYTAGKDGFKILNGDHLPKAPEPQSQRQNAQFYPRQQLQNQFYSRPSHREPSHQPLFRPDPVPFEAYRNAPNAPAYRGNSAPYEEASGQHPYHHASSPYPQHEEHAHYEGPYRQAPPAPQHSHPTPQYHPRQYSVQEGNYDKSSLYLPQQFGVDYREEGPRTPHSFGNGYSFEFAG